MTDINQLLQKASHFAKKGRLEDAAVLLKKAIKQAPKSVPALNTYGITLAQLGNFPLAVEQFVLILKVQPANIAALENLARCYLAMQKFQKAKAVYEKILKIDAKSYGAYFGLAGSLMSLSHYDESLEMFQKAESLNQNMPQLYINLGSVYSQLGRDDDAVHSFKKAIKLDSNSIQANLRLAQLFMKHNEAVNAEPLLSKINKIQPDNFYITLNLADACLQNSKQDQALKLYFQADKLAQKSLNVYTKLDKLILHDGTPDKESLLSQLGEKHVFETWQEAKELSSELLELTDYFDVYAVKALQLFFDGYDPGTLHSRQWWQEQLDLFGDVKFGHDKILRGVHSVVFSWSLPDNETLTQIAGFIQGDRLCSYGAGSALWERLLSDNFSIDVVASDFSPRHSFLTVNKEDYSTTVISSTDVIFLAWIIRGDQGVFNILNQMNEGQKLVLIGEPPDEYGIARICGTSEMFSLLNKEFSLVKSIPLVSFSMLNDTACLYVKN